MKPQILLILGIMAIVLVSGCTSETGQIIKDVHEKETPTTIIPICTPDWECTQWNECSIEGLQTRACTDKNECNTYKNKPNEARKCTPAVETIKSNAQKISYDSLMRYNENFVDEIVTYRGEVIQVIEISKNSYVLRVAVTKKTYIWDDIIWAYYSGERLLKGDIIDFWGRVKGLKTYTAVLGNEITIPEIEILIVERCIPDWDCSNWEPCIFGFQSRDCVDLNKCGSTDKPEEYRECYYE